MLSWLYHNASSTDICSGAVSEAPNDKTHCPWSVFKDSTVFSCPLSRAGRAPKQQSKAQKLPTNQKNNNQMPHAHQYQGPGATLNTLLV